MYILNKTNYLFGKKKYVANGETPSDDNWNKGHGQSQDFFAILKS